MLNLRLSSNAIDDLKTIGRYTQENWGVKQRNKYLVMLDNCFKTISMQPEIGITCDYIRSGYRKHHAGRHLIFYRRLADTIEIIRILHDSMDVERHL